MKKKTVVLSSAIVAALVLGGGGAALATGVVGDDVPAADRDRAAEAALAEVGDGTVTEVDDLDDGLRGYEVEVVRADGREAVVLLDDSFAVTSARLDDDRRGDDDGDDDRGDDRRAGGSAGGSDTDDDATDGAGAAGASGPDDAPISEDERARASEAALTAAGDGTVTDVDRSDDGDHAWDVDVQRADGSEVEVDLDDAFGVVRTEVDDQR